MQDFRDLLQVITTVLTYNKLVKIVLLVILWPLKFDKCLKIIETQYSLVQMNK
jgi:general stress protein CsbA